MIYIISLYLLRAMPVSQIKINENRHLSQKKENFTSPGVIFSPRSTVLHKKLPFLSL